MTKVLSPKYPGLYVGDVDVQFVDGIADVDDERTLARLRRLDSFGVRVLDGDESDEQDEQHGEGGQEPDGDEETLDYDELTDEQLTEIADARNEAAGDGERVIDGGEAGLDREGLIAALREHDAAVAAESDGQSDDQGGGEQPKPEAPKKSASQTEWATYAAAVGVQVEADTKRNDIIAAVAAAGV